MVLTTKFRLILSFLSMCLLVGGLSLVVGGRLINRAVLSEATNRVRLDLNAAREIYNNRQLCVAQALKLTSMEPNFISAVATRDLTSIHERLQDVAGQIGLDFAGLVTNDGETISRLGSGSHTGTDLPVLNQRVNPAVLLALERGELVSGTVVLHREDLIAEDPALAERARISLIPTPRATPVTTKEETAGMTFTCAIPIFDQSLMLGVLYGGVLLSRDEKIVDRIKDTVFQQEIYEGKSVGTATIFFRDMRIATNVLTPEGERAIGTRVSEEVRQKVLEGGERWTDRAFVVHDWYITAYEPITDVSGDRVGILYVGVLEAKYVDMRRNTLLVFVAIIATGMILAVFLGFILGERIWRPVLQLIEVSKRVSAGDLSPEIGHISASEFGVLQKTFMEMLSSLRERDRRRIVESENKLLQSEKQASVGRLAAGVAHEINNPLTGVLTFTHMLLRRKDINDEIRQDLETIAQSTERVRNIVKGLLDFSRQTKIEPELIDVDVLVSETIGLIANQALVKGVEVHFDPGEELPQRTLDKSQFQSVLLNIILNALDATALGGRIDITTRKSLSTATDNSKGIEIEISETGCGIPADHLDKLFNPFCTTQEVGKGTGLGLSVSFGIVARHGGTIRVTSRIDRGSTFTIWLPLSEEAE